MSTDVSRVSVQVGREEISFETGKLAKQASGAVVVRAGDTVVLGTATAGNLRDVDFLPLTVDVEERMYAAGKIPGSFFKREGRAGEKGTLTARMIDRPIRPLFPKGWHYETQIVAMPLSVDHVYPYDILAMNAASAALMVSSVPRPSGRFFWTAMRSRMIVFSSLSNASCAFWRNSAYVSAAGSPEYWVRTASSTALVASWRSSLSSTWVASSSAAP